MRTTPTMPFPAQCKPVERLFVIGWLIVAFGLLSGCAFQPQKLKQAGVDAADKVGSQNSLTASKEILTPAQPASITVSNGVVSLAWPSSEKATVNASSSQVASSVGSSNIEISSKFTAGQKMILWGIGLILITVALLIAWKYAKTTAAGQALSLADDRLAGYIRRLRDRASLETDAKRQAEINADVAHLEGERGRLAAKK